MAVPYEWNPGDKLSEVELNANFQYLCDLIEAQPDIVSQLNERISTLETCKNQQEAQIQGLLIQVANLEDRVEDLENP